MKHGSLFSGIGGFDLAAEWMGWDNIFHCEWNEFGRKILKYYWPDAESFSDITKTDFKKYANKIDILTGGFPCQPFSLAGKRKGTDDERYLWHEMLRAVQEIEPTYVIAENVFGITNIDGGLVFEQVCIDLENEGYEVQPFIIPAAAKNAPHRRDRVWFIAYRKGAGITKEANVRKREMEKPKPQNRSEFWDLSNSDGKSRVTLDTNGNGCDQCDCEHEKHTSERGLNAQRNVEPIRGNDSDTNRIRLERRKHTDREKREVPGLYASTLCSSIGRTEWQNFPTQPPICGGDDGLPSELDRITFSKWRKESIKAYGNAIVPQVAYEIFKAL